MKTDIEAEIEKVVDIYLRQKETPHKLALIKLLTALFKRYADERVKEAKEAEIKIINEECLHCFCKNYKRTDGKLVLVCCKCNLTERYYK